MELKNTSDLSMDISMNLVRYKIVFVGDVAVGKTSIINRLMDGKFSDSYDVGLSILIICQYINFVSAFYRSRFFLKDFKV